jgi:hypothetical protein
MAVEEVVGIPAAAAVVDSELGRPETFGLR